MKKHKLEVYTPDFYEDVMRVWWIAISYEIPAPSFRKQAYLKIKGRP